MTHRLLTLCKVIDKRLWAFAHPLRQFPHLSHIVLNRLEEKKLSVDRLKEMRKDEIGKDNSISAAVAVTQRHQTSACEEN